MNNRSQTQKALGSNAAQGSCEPSQFGITKLYVLPFATLLHRGGPTHRPEEPS
jgi:hypothetical protein